MRNLNKILFIAIAGILIVSCRPEGDDLTQKKALLKEKTTALRTLQKEVEMLKEEVAKLSPEIIPDSTLVTVQDIENTDFVRRVLVQGSVVANETVYASSTVGGRLISMNVKEGQQVSRGHLIATVDMETVEKSIAELETALSLANTLYERQKRLWEQEIGSEIQYLQAKNNKERLEKNLATAKSQLKHKNVYAPISGTVQMEFIGAGEVAGPGTPIVEILDTRNLKIQADVPEQYLTNIKKGTKVHVAFPALNKEMDSKVTLVGASIDPSNRTFKVETSLNNNKREFKPNLLAELSFTDMSKDDVVTIPLDIVQEEVSGKKYVYKVTKDQKGRDQATKAFITLGESYDGRVVIENGLVAGDQLVVAGGRSLTEGSLLDIEK